MALIKSTLQGLSDVTLISQGLLYAGTEEGMYISLNDGKNWSPFQLNLPLVPITDLLIKDENLVVATQGRSLYIIDDLTPLYQMNEATNQTSYLFGPKPSYRMRGGQRKDLKTAGTNHPAGAMTYFFIKEKIDTVEVSLTYADASGKADSYLLFEVKTGYFGGQSWVKFVCLESSIPRR